MIMISFHYPLRVFQKQSVCIEKGIFQEEKTPLYAGVMILVDLENFLIREDILIEFIRNYDELAFA